MNTTSEVILRQLENEGVRIVKVWGMQFVESGRPGHSQVLGIADLTLDAVDDAISHTIRITGLLSKLRDSLRAEEQGELGDLLVTPQEAR